ncbi:MAG: cytochrome c, partial [Gemmatimonadetes bacterium]|nr:cytochrome c [Gemmatimonadota bacterium]
PGPTLGAALYNAQCAACHGVTGEGDGFNAPFMPVAPTVHADSAAMSLRTDDTLYDGIHGGGWILGKSHRMPAFGASLDDAQKRALVAHIRTLCRCQGPYWSRDGRRGR